MKDVPTGKTLIRPGYGYRVLGLQGTYRNRMVKHVPELHSAVATCAVATPVATFWPPDRKETASDFSETASDLLFLPVGMTGFEPATP